MQDISVVVLIWQHHVAGALTLRIFTNAAVFRFCTKQEVQRQLHPLHFNPARFLPGAISAVLCRPVRQASPVAARGGTPEAAPRRRDSAAAPAQQAAGLQLVLLCMADPLRR